MDKGEEQGVGKLRSSLSNTNREHDNYSLLRVPNNNDALRDPSPIKYFRPSDDDHLASGNYTTSNILRIAKSNFDIPSHHISPLQRSPIHLIGAYQAATFHLFPSTARYASKERISECSLHIWRISPFGLERRRGAQRSSPNLPSSRHVFAAGQNPFKHR
ncbi:hypothetical protein Q9189_006499 [Teloschistes chrysophthalmus]